ncbi:MAG: peroxidase-related enzyme [Streptosporangiaceae bacterium]
MTATDASTGGTRPPRLDFTLDELVWEPRIRPVPPDDSSSRRPDGGGRPPKTTASSPYYRTLAHDPAVLAERSALYDAIMYHRGGVSRADRELAALAVSRINGCRYCASVHGRRLVQLTKDPVVAPRILEGMATDALEERSRAIVDLAQQLTRTPPAPIAGQLAALRQAGFSKAELLDLVEVVALFAWANRLMQTLGDPRRRTDSDPGATTRRANSAPRGRDELLRSLAGAVEPLATAIGPDAEVILYDLAATPQSVVAVGGTVTDVEVGSPPGPELSYQLRNGGGADLVSYTHNRDGRLVHSSTVFLRDDSGQPTACLCINLDRTRLQQVSFLLEGYLTAGVSRHDDIEEAGAHEQFPLTVEDLADQLIREAIEEVGIPVALMQKQHKVAVVSRLQTRGLFSIRDAVDLAAKALNVTRFTVYNYLNELQDRAEGQS